MKRTVALAVGVLLACSACGSDARPSPAEDTSATDAGATDASCAAPPCAPRLTCEGDAVTFPDLDDHCTEAGDCVLVRHQNDCCGSFFVAALNAGANAAFQDVEAQCKASYPSCRCEPLPILTEDGNFSSEFGDIRVRCAAGRCESFIDR